MKLQAVGLRGARDLMPTELSGGMARRVALARAIALDPMMIMYDEPFTGQDPITVGVIMQLIRLLNDTLGLTSIIVSHDVQEVSTISDHIYMISEGKVIQHGTPVEMSQSRLAYVNQFMHGCLTDPRRSIIRPATTRGNLLRVAAMRRSSGAIGGFAMLDWFAYLGRAGLKVSSNGWGGQSVPAAGAGQSCPACCCGRGCWSCSSIRWACCRCRSFAISGLNVAWCWVCRCTTRWSISAPRNRSARWWRCRW